MPTSPPPAPPSSNLHTRAPILNCIFHIFRMPLLTSRIAIDEEHDYIVLNNCHSFTKIVSRCLLTFHFAELRQCFLRRLLPPPPWPSSAPLPPPFGVWSAVASLDRLVSTPSCSPAPLASMSTRSSVLVVSFTQLWPRTRNFTIQQNTSKANVPIHSGFGETVEYDTLIESNCTSCAVTADKSSYWTPIPYFQDNTTGEWEAVTNTGGMLP